LRAGGLVQTNGLGQFFGFCMAQTNCSAAGRREGGVRIHEGGR